MMKQKLGIFTAMILTLAIAGSTFAASFPSTTQNNMTAAKSTKKATKTKRHKKTHKAAKHTAKKAAAATTPSSK